MLGGSVRAFPTGSSSKGLSMPLLSRVQPERTARASAIEGSAGSSSSLFGISWVRRRALAASALTKPPLRSSARAYWPATETQSFFRLEFGDDL